MKNKAKMLLRWLGVFLLCFITIYLIVFFGGWRIFESGDPIRDKYDDLYYYYSWNTY